MEKKGNSQKFIAKTTNKALLDDLMDDLVIRA
jgi:hypothetical protein